ncbi:MAG: ribulose 1,5-bisphosphate carboxylase [Acetobacteraceae bacterium]|nr:ribulose 1,5-bisphosphate carboxylase [Acetobacteraceae bacterium]
MASRITAIYRVQSEAASIEDRALGLAIEQSVEAPLAAIDDPRILSDIVGEVQGIEALGNGEFQVRIGLAAATIGEDAGQLLNMLFGNSSLQDDITLFDLEIPPSLAVSFGGPRHGLPGLRQRAGAAGRALTCSALKPQGLSAARLADIAERFALGGIDFVKDDHGLADQGYSPFAERVCACSAAVRKAASVTGHPTHYVPNLSGSLDDMRNHIRIAREAGVDTVMIAPMIAGLATLQALVRENPDLAFFAHPAMAGSGQIAPELLIGKIFPLLGADGVIFPHQGGRFGYSAERCRRIADNARFPANGFLPSAPVPAGGITLERVGDILDFYGSDTMLLIGGSLLAARERLTEATAAFIRTVLEHRK